VYFLMKKEEKWKDKIASKPIEYMQNAEMKVKELVLVKFSVVQQWGGRVITKDRRPPKSLASFYCCY
jgi:hypothetical protein